MQVYIIIFSEKHIGTTGHNGIFKSKSRAIDYLKAVYGFKKVTETLYRNEYDDELEIYEETVVE